MIVLQLAVVLAVGGAAAALFLMQRASRIPPALLTVFAAITGVALAAMVLSDWPIGTANGFWSAHSVIVETLTGLLLAGTIYLAFEARETQRQDLISESLAATAFGGLVDHLVDVDLALTYLGAGVAPPVDSWREPGRPLRWMRDPACDADREAADGLRRESTQVVGVLLAPDGIPPADAEALIDQALRRLMAAMRDWAPLLTVGRDGRAVLVRVGQLRNLLLKLQATLGTDEAANIWRALRRECQVMALGLEVASGSPILRGGVFPTLTPGLGSAPSEMTTYAPSSDGEPAKAGRRQAQLRRLLGSGSLSSSAWRRT